MRAGNRLFFIIIMDLSVENLLSNSRDWIKDHSMPIWAHKKLDVVIRWSPLNCRWDLVFGNEDGVKGIEEDHLRELYFRLEDERSTS